MIDSIDPYLRYLTIPQKYGPTTGLFWSSQGDSIITWAGQIFAFTEQVSLFMEGFASQRPLPHFGYLLDLLRLLGHGDSPQGWTAVSKSMAIRKAYRLSGSSPRNAGAFLGILCEEVPRAVMVPHDAVSHWLAQTPYRNALCASRRFDETMPWEANRFHKYIGEQLDFYSEDEFHYWLRQGHSPVDDEGEAIAKELVAVKPPPRRGSLETLMKERTRLSGAIPLVNAMLSALTLPPRRRTPPQLPLGGYADVTTRGEPERLLLSQLALDPDDFVRRFAEKELLYFRREEPQERTREKLVLLLDQGVRTWGTARLALSAAVLAFARIAAKKKLPFHIRFGSRFAERIDPATCDPTILGDLLEASDLSRDPAELMEAEAGDEDCDVVLLTHPRSLLEAEVKSAASELAERSRLFTLTTEEDGQVEFSELRGGEPLCITRFRVDFTRTQTKPIPPFVPTGDMWRGDVEPIPFPFPFGVTTDKLAGIAFDAQATRLLVATRQPMLHVWNIADGTVEVLPRPLIDGRLVSGSHFLGVRDGFVIAGMMESNLFAVHYDFRTRVVKLHRLGKSNGKGTRWYAFPDLHAITLREDFVCRGLDLDTGAQYAEPEIRDNSSVRAHQAYVKALEMNLPEPCIEVIRADFSPTTISNHFAVYYDSNNGWLFAGNNSSRKAWYPEIEGRPFFKGVHIVDAQWSEPMLALKIKAEKPPNPYRWRLVNCSDENPSFCSEDIRAFGLFQLSHKGKQYAVQSEKGRVKIVDSLSNKLLWLTTRTSVKNPLSVALGLGKMAIFEGKRRLDFQWAEGDLTVSIRRFDPNATLEPGLVPAKIARHPLTEYDSWRFAAVASQSIDVIVAQANHVIAYDPHRSRLVCMFWIRGGRWVAWMPDGTRYGPRDLLGATSTPRALAKIAEALREASHP